MWYGVLGGGLHPDIESCHIIFSLNTYINFKSPLIIYLETFYVINPVKLIIKIILLQMFCMTQHFPKLD